MKLDKRKIGLRWIEEVKKILEEEGHITSGPFSKVIFTKGRKMASHVDIFGVFDIISAKEGVYFLHQVTSLNMLSNKRKKILKSGMTGIIWCHCKINGKVGYRRFNVNPFRYFDKEVFWETSSVTLL